MNRIQNIETKAIVEVELEPVWVGGVWECGNVRFTDPDKAIYQAVPADVSPKQLTPVEFKMCFTSAERLAITAIRDNAEHPASPTLKDVYSILDDPRLKIVDLGLQSNLDLIDFLVSLNVLTSGRAAEIKDGVIL